MASTQRPRSSRRPSSNSDPASRGLILIVVAIVLGAILLWKGGAIGFDSDGSAVAIGDGGGDPTETTAPAETTTTEATNTTVAPASVKVVAANGAGVAGLAGNASDFLVAQGYTSTSATDAVASADITKVYAAEGFEGNAEVIAGLFKVDASTIEPIPAEPLATEQPSDTGIVVVLGPDAVTTLASQTAAAE